MIQIKSKKILKTDGNDSQSVKKKTKKKKKKQKKQKLMNGEVTSAADSVSKKLVEHRSTSTTITTSTTSTSTASSSVRKMSWKTTSDDSVDHKEPKTTTSKKLKKRRFSEHEMPGLSSSTDNCIAESLKRSLSESTKSSSEGRHVEKTVTSSAKRALLEKAEIKFVKSSKNINNMLEDLKNKYICLNRSTKSGSEVNGIRQGGSNAALSDSGIPQPKVTLFSSDCLHSNWQTTRRVGAGLNNLGNTCFLNSVLQCLNYTPPLANHLLNDNHKARCKAPGFCMICELQTHIYKCLSSSGGSVKPLGVLQKLKLIAKHMRWGRQEDAHEFLRYVIDSMQRSCLSGVSNSLDKLSKETTLVHQVFGGYLRSQVRCMQCKTTSNTFDPVLDISVDLKGVNSVEKAFEKFVQPEVLDLDNAYKCARCKMKVRALKNFTLHKAPRVLTVHLKRFDYHRLMGGKVSRHIDFSPKLNLRPYMSKRQGDPVIYHLYGVLVHSGHTCNSGHYYCYIKAPNQTWYCMNDSHVSQTGLNSVLRSEAYMLFYIQESVETVKNGHHSDISKKSMLKIASNNRHSNPSNTNGVPSLSTGSKSQQHIQKPALLQTPQPTKVKSFKRTPDDHSTQRKSSSLGDLNKSLNTLNEMLQTDLKDRKSNTPEEHTRGKTEESDHTPNEHIRHKTNVSARTPNEHTREKAKGSDHTPVKIGGSDHTPVKKGNMLNGFSRSLNNVTNIHPSDSVMSKRRDLPDKKRLKINTSQSFNSIDGAAEKKAPQPAMMSPPPLPPSIDLNGHSSHIKSTSPHWKITATNGRARHSSESSVASTTEWQVTPIPNGVLPKTPNSAHAVLNGVNDCNDQLSATKGKGLKRKLKEGVEISSKIPKVPDGLPSEMEKKKKKKKKNKMLSDNSNSSAQIAPIRISSGGKKIFKTDGNDGQSVEKNTKKKKKKQKLMNGEVTSAADSVSKSLVERMSTSTTITTSTTSTSTASSSVRKMSWKTTSDDSVDYKEPKTTTSKKLKKRRFSEPVVQAWDGKQNGCATSKSPSAWDGKKDGNISFILERHCTVKGLGSSVKTWDGYKPEINRQVEIESMVSNYKDGWYNDYEQEIDQGKRKKIKKKKKLHQNTANHFQRIQDNSNTVKQLRVEGKL